MTKREQLWRQFGDQLDSQFHAWLHAYTSVLLPGQLLWRLRGQIYLQLYWHLGNRLLGHILDQIKDIDSD